MATLILTAVGTAIGGPVGGAIGGMLGQQIDMAILGSGKPREGARLKELQIQTSSYGTQFPAILGTMRAAGTVIWATDLVEQRVKSGGGKGQPAVVNFSYVANFAVALSSAPLLRVGRIWADGNLMRGGAGDFKVQTGFRFYAGHADQTADPLMASANGIQRCPAHRGLSYAVFENLQLADYGNRIPSLTFELFERDGSVSLATIAGMASGGKIGGQSLEAVTGYALQGADIVSALRPLFDAAPVFVRPQMDTLSVADWFGANQQLAELVPVANASGNALERPGKSRQPENAAPNNLALRHFEPARDFQAGTQQSQRGRVGAITTLIDCPAAMNANQAKRFADLALLQQHRGRSRISLFAIGPSTGVQIGDWISQGGSRFRIHEIEKFSGFDRIEAISWLDRYSAASIGTDAGIATGQPDAIIGPTQLMVVDLPLLLPTDPGLPQVFVAAAGTGAGWKGANIALRDGDRLIDLGGSAQPATMGLLETILTVHSAQLLDEHNAPVVRLGNMIASMPPGTGDPLSSSAPAIWINGEIIRYGTAEYLGEQRFRLRRLARGLAGTEDKIVPHSLGTQILLLESETLRAVDAIPLVRGEDIHLEAVGLGDSTPVIANAVVAANALRPPIPAHGHIAVAANGDVALSWVRRSRVDPGWSDEVDIPQGEGALLFDIDVIENQSVLASWQVPEEHFVLSATALAAVTAASLTDLSFEVRQVGRYARSNPLYISVNI